MPNYEDRAYLGFLESLQPTRVALRPKGQGDVALSENNDVTEEDSTKNEIEVTEPVTESKTETTVVENEEVPDTPGSHAAPNTDPSADDKENKPKGANPDAVTLTAPGGSATPNPDPASKEFTQTRQQDEPQNAPATWKGTGGYPETFTDPMLATLINKFTAANPDSEGTKDPLRQESADCADCKDKAALSLLEGKEEVTDDEVKNVLEDANKENNEEVTLESKMLNKFLAELDAIEEASFCEDCDDSDVVDVGYDSSEPEDSSSEVSEDEDLWVYDDIDANDVDEDDSEELDIDDVF